MSGFLKEAFTEKICYKIYYNLLKNGHKAKECGGENKVS